MFTRLLQSGTIVFHSSILLAQVPVQEGAGTLGEQVAAFAETAMSTKVGTGECWDLAQHALNEAGAKWDGRYGFGRLLDTRKEAVERGDVVQFSKVMVERHKGLTIERETMGPHTAIVLVVHEPGRYTLAHQNFGVAGRKVDRYELVMADVKRGTIDFYRPAH